MLKSNLDSAIFGLIGVIVGGIITAGSNYFLENRREKAVINRESQNYAIELRRAARLIDDDLSRAGAAAQICINKRHWWSTDAQPLTLDGWKQNREIIAAELSDSDWLAVRIAIEAADNVRSSQVIGIESNISKISDEVAEKIVPMLKDIEAGRFALAPFTTYNGKQKIK